MKKSTRYVGLDVHAQTIAIAVAEGGRDGEVRSLGTIPNTPEAVRKAVKKLGPVENLAVCYEAGPCGHVLYWQLTELGVRCEVVAPTLVPMRSGDRVKTDRRDAEKLARCYRSGDLTAVWVPDAEHEALRDLARARESAKEDQRRARQHVRHFLLRHGRRPDGATRAWTAKYETWLASVRFEQPALEATMLDYRTEVQHARDRIERLERAIDAVGCGLAVPKQRTGIAFFNAVACAAEPAEEVGCSRVLLLSGLGEPFGGFDLILGHVGASEVHKTQSVLGSRIPLFCSFSKPLCGLPRVMG